jgi:hypothetical protein
MITGAESGKGRQRYGARKPSLRIGCCVSGLAHLCCVLVLGSLHSRLLSAGEARLDDDFAESEMLAVDLATEIGPAAPPELGADLGIRPVSRPDAPVRKTRQRRQPDATGAPTVLTTSAPMPAAGLDDDFDEFARTSTADVLDELDEALEEEPAAPVPAPEVAPPKIPQVSAGLARSLRVYDYFPSMPEPARLAGLAQAVLVQICVSGSGGVSEITMDHRAAASLEEALRSAIRTWRYRPLMVQGSATPFCHALEIRYVTN